VDVAGVALLILGVAAVVMVRVAEVISPHEQEQSAGQSVAADAPQPAGEGPGGLGVADGAGEAL
jgi:hypothetical protein